MGWPKRVFGCWLVAAVLTAVAGAEDAPHVTVEGQSLTATPLPVDDGIPVVAAKDFELTPTAAAAADALLERVEFLSDPPRVRLELSKSVNPIAGTRPAEAGKPPRVALNLPHAAVGAAVPAVVAASGAVLRVRTKEIRPGVVQVVADLRPAMTYSVERNGKTITVALAPKPETRATPAAPAKPGSAKPAPVALGASHDDAKPAPVTVAPLSENARPAAPSGDKPSLDALAAGLEKMLASGGKVPGAQPPARTSEAKERERARIAAETMALEAGTAVPPEAAPSPEPSSKLESKPLSSNLERTPDPELAVEAVEETVATGDAGAARAAVVRAKAMTLAPVLASRAHAAAARAALLEGDVDGAATEAAETSDLAVRAQVACAAMTRPGGSALASTLLKPVLVPALAAGTEAPFEALMVAGNTSVAEGAFDSAEDAYKRALERATTATERAAAGSGLARAARAGGDHATAAGVLSELAHAGADDPLIRRLATAAARAGVRDVP